MRVRRLPAATRFFIIDGDTAAAAADEDEAATCIYTQHMNTCTHRYSFSREQVTSTDESEPK